MNSYKTPLGDLQVELFGHASIHFEINGLHIYSDPYSSVADFQGKSPADLILISHSHYDHFDQKAFSEIATDNTLFVVASDVTLEDYNSVVLHNEDVYAFGDIHIKAVAAYNINRRNENGQLFHPKGVGNGYVLDFGGFTVYIAGDTEPIPQMKSLTYPDIAFLPKNLPYTMTDEEFIEAANLIKPKYLYPYHYFEIEIPKLKKFLDLGITLVEQ